MSPRKAAFLFDISIVLAITLTFLSFWTWTGPVNWLCLLEMRMFGGYEEKITILVVAIVLWVIFAFPVFFWRELDGKETEDKLPRALTLLIWSIPFAPESPRPVRKRNAR